MRATDSPRCAARWLGLPAGPALDQPLATETRAAPGWSLRVANEEHPIFALAWAGLRRDSLIRLQQKHTALVKTLTASSSLLVTALILFGTQLTTAISGK